MRSELRRGKSKDLRGFRRRDRVFCSRKWQAASRKLRFAGGNAKVFRGRVHHLRPLFLEAREWVRINIGFCDRVLCCAGDVLNCVGRNRRVRSESNVELCSMRAAASEESFSPGHSCSGSSSAADFPTHFRKGRGKGWGTVAASSRWQGLGQIVRKTKRELGQEWQRVKHW